MWAILRVVLFEWILARLGLRWLVALLVAVPLALVFFLGIPMLLVLGAVIFLAWRFVRRRYPPQPGQAPDVM
ncbi:MAG TPA: hypothetical protein VHE78_09165 [Gemmatimonadaceae bacterium]|nr:hypothetical protein [Gemmatimonadaceae bacterium]